MVQETVIADLRKRGFTRVRRADDTRTMEDGQLIEIINTHKAIQSALEAQIDVARPERDDGIDLIIYTRKGGPWISAPVQIKSRFSIEKKYQARPGLVMCYVCGQAIYVLTHEEAENIATRRGYTNTASWTEKGGYSCTVGGALAQDLEHCKATRERWAAVLFAGQGR